MRERECVCVCGQTSLRDFSIPEKAALVHADTSSKDGRDLESRKSKR